MAYRKELIKKSRVEFLKPKKACSCVLLQKLLSVSEKTGFIESRLNFGKVYFKKVVWVIVFSKFQESFGAEIL